MKEIPVEESIYKHLAEIWGKRYMRQLSAYRMDDGESVYHISPNPNLKMIKPRLTHFTMKNEDRAHARISASLHLDGCLAGAPSTPLNPDSFEHHLFYIYAIDPIDVLVPSKQLVPDAEDSDEVWIAPCAKYSNGIRFRIIGEFYTTEGTVSTQGGFVKERTDYMNIRTSRVMRLDAKQSLPEGDHVVKAYYRPKDEKFEMTIERALSAKDYAKDVKKYTEKKALKIASFENMPPSLLGW